MPVSTLDSDRTLLALSSQKVTLDLTTLDLCFALALYLRAQGAGLTSFTEDRLVDVFEQVCELLEPSRDNVRAGATHAIRRLREQRLLARVDGAGVVRAGQYALSRLGASIVEFFLDEDVLTRESLTLLMRTLKVHISEIVALARASRTEVDLGDNVLPPLKVTVRDLTDGIERRQRGLDHQQEEFRREIGRLIETDWLGAIDRCQGLLESTASTLRELNAILLRDSHELYASLQDLVELALERGHEELHGAAERVIDQVDRIVAWGMARQQSWSEYYDHVHRYLRDVVRLDPTRALSRRLRDQLVSHLKTPFSLVITQCPPLRVLRDDAPTEMGAPVRRRKKDHESGPEAVPAEDPLSAIEQRVTEELACGVDDLASLTARITAELPESERFVVAGRIAELVARRTRQLGTKARPWVRVETGLCIEQWSIPRQKAG